jgi:hypothetical protein
MKTVWVVEPYPDGTCRVYSVTTKADGSFHVGEPFWHWTTMVLDGHPAYEVPEDEVESQWCAEPDGCAPRQTCDR